MKHVTRNARLAPLLLLLLAALALPAAAGAQGAGDGSEPWLEATIEIQREGQGLAIFHFHEPAQLPSSLIELVDREEASSRERVADSDAVILRFAPRELEEVARLFTDLPSDRTGVSVVIRVPEALVGGDLWRFQAELTRERLRRIRIVSGN